MGSIVILTGAGISAESGLGSFRDKGGLWAKFNPTEPASPRAFAKDPARQHAGFAQSRGGASTQMG